MASTVRIKQQAAKTGTATVFSNYDWSLELLGEIVIGLVQKTASFSREEIMTLIEAEDMVDPTLMAKARAMVSTALSEVGFAIPAPPTPPNPQMLENVEPTRVQAIMQEYQRQAAEFQDLTSKIDDQARPIAINLILDEIKNLDKGRYRLKVSLGPSADTVKILRAIETLELHKTLVESNLQGLSRKALIEAVDPHNKEELIAEPQRLPQSSAA